MPDQPRRRFASKAVRMGVVPIVATAFLAGCGDDDEQAYCVDQNGVVVDNDQCDDDYDSGVSSGFFWFFTGSSYGRGARVPTSGGTRIAASDRAALASRGGFGSKAHTSGIGRVSKSSGG